MSSFGINVFLLIYTSLCSTSGLSKAAPIAASFCAQRCYLIPLSFTILSELISVSDHRISAVTMCSMSRKPPAVRITIGRTSWDPCPRCGEMTLPAPIGHLMSTSTVRRCSDNTSTSSWSGRAFGGEILTCIKVSCLCLGCPVSAQGLLMVLSIQIHILGVAFLPVEHLADILFATGGLPGVTVELLTLR
ncbi:hypothetical protein C8Q73DRAFT_494461 [Cubamyces lactineus]|nr:hypothetical protein C8Q73DRAFT_494461 [Cubamyces lactineus]